MGERQGLPLNADISAANVNDHIVLEDLVDGMGPVRQPVGRPRQRPGNLHGDKGYDYTSSRNMLRQRNITPRIARRGIESATRLGRHRYVIEAPWSGSAAFDAWPVATTARLPTSPDSCAWHAP